MTVFSLKQRILAINTVQLNNGTFFLKDQKDGNSNLDFIIDYFDSPAPKKPSKKKKFEILFSRIIINNLHFKYKNLKRNTVEEGVTFDDIDVKEMNGILKS